MSIFEIILLAIALGIDCMIVSFSQGLILKEDRIKNSLFLALTMGLFQGLMPYIGSIATDYIVYFIAPFSKWITFAIFFLLGLQFILDSKKQETEDKQICLKPTCLLVFGIATSIDALISGVSLNLTYTRMLPACLIIGIVSFVMAMTGFWTGNLFNILSKKQLQILGGIILIFLAIKSLIF